MLIVFLTTVFDPDVEPNKEHREIFEGYKKLVSAFPCCVNLLTCMSLSVGDIMTTRSYLSVFFYF